MNKCIYCQKEVIYPEGVYLKSGKEVHVICYQQRKFKGICVQCRKNPAKQGFTFCENCLKIGK